MSQAVMAFILAAGGGVGAVCRFLAGILLMKVFPAPRIPVAMVIVNLTGSLGLGLLYGGMYDEPHILYEDAIFTLLGIGFFGAFTTFSTFSVEAVQLLMNKQYKKVTAYITISILGSILGFALGFILINL
jgi:CrcB protein